MDALADTSQRPDARPRLFVGLSLAGEVARTNTCATSHEVRCRHLRRTATTDSTRIVVSRPTLRSVPRGNWSSCRRCGARCVPQTASRHTVCTSARDWSAWTARQPAWRTLLPPILTDAAARRGPGLDLRSRAYQAVGRPTGLDDQTVTLRIRPMPGGPAHIGDAPSRNGFVARRQATSFRRRQTPSGSPGHRRRPRHTLVARGRSARRTEPNLDVHAPVRRMRCREAAVIGQPGFPPSGSNAGIGRPVPSAAPHAPSQGIVPATRRARMASACSLTSSYDQRSNANSIDWRSRSRNSGLT